VEQYRHPPSTPSWCASELCRLVGLVTGLGAWKLGYHSSIFCSSKEVSIWNQIYGKCNHNKMALKAIGYKVHWIYPAYNRDRSCFEQGNEISGQYQWPRGLRRRSKAARLLRLWVRIPPRAWTFVCCECCVCCQVEVSATGWSPVQESPTDCHGSLCVI